MKKKQLEVCPSEEDKLQLLRVASLLKNPNSSAQDLMDLMNPQNANKPMERSAD